MINGGRKEYNKVLLHKQNSICFTFLSLFDVFGPQTII